MARMLSTRKTQKQVWYVVDENGTVLVLLNGAEEKHTIKLSYKRAVD
jgi:hypothetical protein